MKKNYTLKKIRSGFFLLPLLSFSLAKGAPLVYEGFNYGGSSGSIGGTTTNALGLTGDYTTVDGWDSGTNTQTSEYITASLNFSGFSTSGGALRQTLVADTDEKKELVYSYAPFNITAPAPGTTIYQSFLSNVASNTMNESSAYTEVRVQDSATMQSNGSGQMKVYPQANNATSEASVGYQNGTGYGDPITLGTTYLYIAKFTNVDGAGGGDASLWVLDNTSYNEWMTAGNGVEGALGTYADVVATNSDSDSITFSSLQSLRFATAEFSVDYNAAATSYNVEGELSVTYDEIRYGTSLGDVVVIPEASTSLLVLVGMLACFGLGRKKK